MAVLRALCGCEDEKGFRGISDRRLIIVRSTPAVAILMLLLLVPFPASAATPQPRPQKTNHQQTESGTSQRFLSALRAYKARQYAAAQKQLEALVQIDPGSFEINELLGLVYVAQGKQA